MSAESGVESEQNPLSARGYLVGPVHLEDRNRCSPRRRQAQDGSRCLQNAEMLMPEVLARMIEAHGLASHLVISFESVGFVQVAGAARQCAVGVVVGTVPRAWNNMLNLEWKIEMASGARQYSQRWAARSATTG
jgi:hypothetical protein